jgi:hypothetical protein
MVPLVLWVATPMLHKDNNIGTEAFNPNWEVNPLVPSVEELLDLVLESIRIRDKLPEAFGNH